jgi:uncharacterized surface protein with fasciclin (FAS1) repeats
MIRRTLVALAASSAFALAMGHADDNLVEVAREAGDFGTLLPAAEAADLVETLTGKGPFTVFAPTDAAIAELPEGTVDSVVREENPDRLTRLLTPHALAQRVMSSDLSDGMTATSVQGSDLAIDGGDAVTVNGATVATPDIEASNEVIPMVDAVPLPEGS